MIETEYKFLINAGKLLKSVNLSELKSKYISSGYFTEPNGAAVRVTLSSLNKAFICIKSNGTLSREEFEYEIPYRDAVQLLNLSPTLLHKKRYYLDGWEIDHIYGYNGFEIWIAEWEQDNDKLLPSTLPEWIEKDVTEDKSYHNQSLAWKHGIIPKGQGLSKYCLSSVPCTHHTLFFHKEHSRCYLCKSRVPVFPIDTNGFCQGTICSNCEQIRNIFKGSY